ARKSAGTPAARPPRLGGDDESCARHLEGGSAITGLYRAGHLHEPVCTVREGAGYLCAQGQCAVCPGVRQRPALCALLLRRAGTWRDWVVDLWAGPHRLRECTAGCAGRRREADRSLRAEQRDRWPNGPRNRETE